MREMVTLLCLTGLRQIDEPPTTPERHRNSGPGAPSLSPLGPTTCIANHGTIQQAHANKSNMIAKRFDEHAKQVEKEHEHVLNFRTGSLCWVRAAVGECFLVL